MLRAENISYQVGAQVLLRQVSLHVRQGSFTALIGPNGAGKSTLLKILSGDLLPDSGQVYMNDKPLGSYANKQLALLRAVMPQQVLLAFSFTSEEVVMMGRYPHRSRNGMNDEVIVTESMQRTETESLRGRIYPTLSGGEQARVTLARLLSQESPLLLLDEPTASLDPRHQHLVMRIARQVARGGGAVLAVLHDLNLAAAYADHVVILGDGEVKADGSPTEVFQTGILEDVFQTKFYVTAHPYTTGPLIVSLPD